MFDLDNHRLEEVCQDAMQITCGASRKLQEAFADIYASVTDNHITTYEYKTYRLVDSITVYDVYQVVSKDIAGVDEVLEEDDILVIHRMGQYRGATFALLSIFAGYDRHKRLPSKTVGVKAMEISDVRKLLKHCFLIDSGV